MDIVTWEERGIVFPVLSSSTVLPVYGWAGSAHTAAVLKAGIRLSCGSRDSLLEVRDRQQESTKAGFRAGGKHWVFPVILCLCLANRTRVYGGCLLLYKQSLQNNGHRSISFLG